MPDDKIRLLKKRDIETKIDKAYLRWLETKRDVNTALRVGDIVASEWDAGWASVNTWLWGERRANKTDA